MSLSSRHEGGKGQGKGWSGGKEFVERHRCDVCGAEHYVAPCYKKRSSNSGRFCSKKCRGIWKSRQPGARVSAACLNCGTEVKRYPSQMNGSVCCSMKCVQQLKAKARGVTRCLRCGFVILKNRKFCKACRPASQPSRPKPFEICESCGLIFSPGAGDRGRYCGFECVSRAKAATAQMSNPYSKARGGKRSDLNNCYFRSAWEANWARYLNLLKRAGHVNDWAFEPVTFEFAGIRRGSRFYTPDFRVVNPDGSVEFHEIKGFMDPRSATKLKRMAKYHPNVKIVLIGGTDYKAVADKVAAIIPGWERGTVHNKPTPMPHCSGD